MKHIRSTEFRKQYAKLTDPTVVMVNGHPIGTWIPGYMSRDIQGYWAVEEKPGRASVAKLPGGGVQARQAQRDALLGKINRGTLRPK